ncbi:MAG: hypothetical protein COY40_07005 [Alphaproteobacteria bacterium CG_4_10_14_0_8_um_filter_53_9]|nr:MAG: hypothetical protein COY40_07005 [Alphaproteobacteria bacterium CG_4_10_14_0_8_um_filter_53_9]
MKYVLKKIWHPFATMRKTLALAPLADDLHNVWQEREDRPLTPHERELLENALNMSEITAEDVCVPRGEIKAVPLKANFTYVMEMFKETYHSRLLVYGGDLDEIKGMVMLKDMAQFFDKPQDFQLEKQLRQVVPVPENMTLPKVLQVMKRSKTQMVVVMDEFGGVSGVLVLKDILEELVGEIDDEHESDNDFDFIEKGKGIYVVDAGMELEDLGEKLVLPLEEMAGDEVDTLGGWVMQAAQRIPQRGDVVSLAKGLKVTVVQATPKRLVKLELHVEK